MRHIWILILFFSTPLFCQEDLSLGFSVGISNYQGDLTPQGISSFGRTSPTGALFLRILHSDFFNTRLNIQYGTVEAHDADGGPGRVSRNLSFKSHIWEAALIEEVNLLGFHPGTRRFFSPYLFGGVAVFHFNPTTEYLGQVVELQPLGTEGQGIPGYSGKYSLFQVAIPIGGGLKLGLGKDATLSIEVGGRKLFTDYLDDVSGPYADSRVLLKGNGPLSAALGNRMGEYYNSDPVNTPGAPRGNPKYQDWYFFSTVSLAFALDGDGSLFGRNMRIIPCFKF
ncbi:MAG: hypothetical protein IPL49_05165 [Saprospirales bacterium]|nr:hypothetical protein [Saprospirales bacterium]